VRRREPGADLPRDFDGLVLRQAADAPEQRRQILAVHVLHRQEQQAVRFADVVDTTDVRMRNLPRRPRFVVKLRQLLRILFQRRRQELQRDRLTETEIVGAVDLAHPAAPEQANHAVALLKDLSRLKAAVIDRPRRAKPAARRRELPGTEAGFVSSIHTETCRIVGHATVRIQRLTVAVHAAVCRAALLARDIWRAAIAAAIRAASRPTP
jgi:hypothetical protein